MLEGVLCVLEVVEDVRCVLELLESVRRILEAVENWLLSAVRTAGDALCADVLEIVSALCALCVRCILEVVKVVEVVPEANGVRCAMGAGGYALHAVLHAAQYSGGCEGRAPFAGGARVMRCRRSGVEAWWYGAPEVHYRLVDARHGDMDVWSSGSALLECSRGSMGIWRFDVGAAT